MPMAAIQLGAVDEVLAIDQVARAIVRFDARG
jgi:chemotaxis response regulator CheB